MVKIKSLRDLKFVDPKISVVFVETKSRIFVRNGQEWVQRMYFTSKEISELTKIETWKVRYIAKVLGIRNGGFSYVDLNTIIKAHNIVKHEKEQYKNLKKRMSEA